MSEFTKDDFGKLRWDKFAWHGAEAVLRVMTHGAEKYGWDNWRNAGAEDLSRMKAAAIRHLKADLTGERLDPESGYPHLFHAACNLLFLCELER